jgi:hypothetical protein
MTKKVFPKAYAPFSYAVHTYTWAKFSFPHVKKYKYKKRAQIKSDSDQMPVSPQGCTPGKTEFCEYSMLKQGIQRNS